MGQKTSRLRDGTDLSAVRKVFIAFDSYRKCTGIFSDEAVYKYEIRYLRFRWFIWKRYQEINSLDAGLLIGFPGVMQGIPRPEKFTFVWTRSEQFHLNRANQILEYIQRICDIDELFNSKLIQLFLDISSESFHPEFGRKSFKEGYLKKTSGGYHAKFSRQYGDYLTSTRWRYVVLRDTSIVWFKTADSKEADGNLQIDSHFRVDQIGKTLIVTTLTRRIKFVASTARFATEWKYAFDTFYKESPRRYLSPHSSSFPRRANADVKVFTFSRDYMASGGPCGQRVRAQIYCWVSKLRGCT